MTIWVKSEENWRAWPDHFLGIDTEWPNYKNTCFAAVRILHSLFQDFIKHSLSLEVKLKRNQSWNTDAPSLHDHRYWPDPCRECNTRMESPVQGGLPGKSTALRPPNGLNLDNIKLNIMTQTKRLKWRNNPQQNQINPCEGKGHTSATTGR